MRNLIKMTLWLLLFPATSFGQSPNSNLQEPEIGKPCPEFVFNKIDFYKTKTLALSELKGKWVVLDFWSIGCSSCVASLPEISREQIALKDKVQFVMVGPEARLADREMYKGYQRKLNLQMPSAFDDAIAKSFNVGLLPHTIIIDPAGIVRAITTSANPVKLKQLMAGQNPVFSKPSYENNKEKLSNFKHTYKLPYLVNGNGGVDSDFVFRSLLSKWRPGNGHLLSAITGNREAMQMGRFEELCGTLQDLYMLAYYGKHEIDMSDTAYYGQYYPVPVFEIADTLLLQSDQSEGKNLFCYSLTVPKEKATEKYMMQVMQSDLKNYFGFQVAVETRRMPYWKLIATPEGKLSLKTKGGPTKSAAIKKWETSTFRNVPVKRLLSLVAFYSEVTYQGPPLLDETGISTNIDIDLDWVKNDLPIIRKALQKNGLDLVKGEKEMKVFVIRDQRS